MPPFQLPLTDDHCRQAKLDIKLKVESSKVKNLFSYSVTTTTDSAPKTVT